MAGCDTKPIGGDHGASRKRVLTWMGVSAAVGGLLAFLSIADAVGLASLGGGAALIAVAAIIVGAAAAAVLGFWVGFMVEWFFNRLKEHDNPKTISIAGLIECAGKNTGVPPINDNDWTFNMDGGFRVTDPVLAGLDNPTVRTRAAPDSDLPQAFPTVDPEHGDVQVFHCEISSHMGSYAAVGGAVGAVAGTVAGLVAGAAICAALAIATLGLAIAVCALIVAAMALAGAFAGGVLGDLIGAGIGAIADAVSDLDQRGEAVRKGCMMNLTGTWVTDIGHQHNEIHDVTSAQIIECGITSTSSGLVEAGAVGIGRHPTGPDP